jgi:hypothetical protein
MRALKRIRLTLAAHWQAVKLRGRESHLNHWLSSRNKVFVPAWLAEPQQTHWVGALFSNEWLSHQWMRPSQVTTDFDGVIFFRKVHAETVPEMGKYRAP